MLKHRILFQDILTFVRLDYTDASLKIVYLDVLGINLQRLKSGSQFHASTVFWPKFLTQPG